MGRSARRSAAILSSIIINAVKLRRNGDPDTEPGSRAWQMAEYGDAVSSARLVEVPLREPGPGEVRIRTVAAGLNLPDLLLAAGQYQVRPEPPFVLGFELAGVVDAVGLGVGLVEGTRVLGLPSFADGDDGGLAEHVVLRERDCFTLHPGASLVEAAGLGIALATAHLALHRRAALRRGEVVLVLGASGGVGSAALQLARAHGAHVLAVAGGPAKAEACLRLGAHEVAGPDDDLESLVRRASAGRGVDVVLDLVGGREFDRARRMLAWEGRLVVAGFAGGEIPQLPVNHVLMRNYSVLGVHLDAYRRRLPEVFQETVESALDLWATGAVRPPEPHVVAFERVAEGWSALRERKVVGKVVAQI